MSGPRCLVELSEAKRVQTPPASGYLHIRGIEMAPGRPQVDLYFNGADSSVVPSAWKQVRVMQVENATNGTLWRLVAADTDHPLYARSVQIHRSAATRMMSVLPKAKPPLHLRLFWWALPRLMRVPGLAGLLKKKE
ncbi:MAG: hypothetical protein QM771_20470 [Nitrospira sp.]